MERNGLEGYRGKKKRNFVDVTHESEISTAAMAAMKKNRRCSIRSTVYFQGVMVYAMQ
jgi:hypothetical protein